MSIKEDKKIGEVENFESKETELESDVTFNDAPEKENEVNDTFITERPKNRDRRKNERKPSRRTERARQEFDSKIISVRRVTRVVSGGRRFSFSVSVVIGDKKGRVGVGVGKSGDTPLAVEKATRDAKKNMITAKLNNKKSISHPVSAKYGSVEVMMMPAPGKGVIAGSAVRVVLELAGVTEVASKILSRSKNKLNIARATVKALTQLKGNKIEITK